MKICFFGYINTQKREGASLSLLNVMEELVSRGHEIYFVSSLREIIPDLEVRGIHCIYLLSYTMRRELTKKGIASDAKYFLKRMINAKAVHDGIKLLSKYHFDMIHINGLDNAVSAKIAEALNIPYVWHIRSFLQEDLGKQLVNEQEVFRYLRRAHGVIGISHAIKDKYQEILRRPVTVIYNGIPMEEYRILPVKRVQEPLVKMMIAGRVCAGKGQLEAVQALAELKRRGIVQIHLTIVGNAEQAYMESIRTCIASEKLESQITILDYCNDLRTLWSQCDIGLVCSKNEAFGRVTIEFMLANMLVIGSNTGGTVELIDHEKTGLLYQQGDIDDLAEKIAYAVQNRETAAQMVATAEIFARDRFSIKRVCDEILELYGTCCKDKDD